jgi:hypothetical protein
MEGMKHAGDEALDRLEDLLDGIRGLPGLKERTRGSFYWRGSAFLHFHEDPEGLFADLKVGAEWERFPAGTRPQRDVLLEKVVRALKGKPRRRCCAEDDAPRRS